MEVAASRVVGAPTIRAMTTLAARLAAILALGALAVTPAAVDAADQSVGIVDVAFEPSEVEITVGDVVTWTNTASRTHTVTADDGTFDSGELGAGDPFANVFETAGSYAYHCTIHPEMTGVVVVAAAASAAPASAEPTPPSGSLPPSAAPTPTAVDSAAPSGSGPPAPTVSPEPAPDGAASEGPPPVAIVVAIVVAVVVALFVIPMPGRRPR
jgi:plastocyanin